MMHFSQGLVGVHFVLSLSQEGVKLQFGAYMDFELGVNQYIFRTCATVTPPLPQEEKFPLLSALDR